MPVSLFLQPCAFFRNAPFFSHFCPPAQGCGCYRFMHRISSGFGSPWALVKGGPRCMGCVCEGVIPFPVLFSPLWFKQPPQEMGSVLYFGCRCLIPVFLQNWEHLHTGEQSRAGKSCSSSCCCWTRLVSLAEGASSRELAGLFFHSVSSGSKG